MVFMLSSSLVISSKGVVIWTDTVSPTSVKLDASDRTSAYVPDYLPRIRLRTFRKDGPQKRIISLFAILRAHHSGLNSFLFFILRADPRRAGEMQSRRRTILKAGEENGMIEFTGKVYG